jgi:hypothetical protein
MLEVVTLIVVVIAAIVFVPILAASPAVLVLPIIVSIGLAALYVSMSSRETGSASDNRDDYWRR